MTITNLNQMLQELKGSSSSNPSQKGIKILTLILEIEKELNQFQDELNLLWTNAYLANDQSLKCLINGNLNKCCFIKQQLIRAKLNISYYFI